MNIVVTTEATIAQLPEGITLGAQVTFTQSDFSCTGELLDPQELAYLGNDRHAATLGINTEDGEVQVFWHPDYQRWCLYEYHGEYEDSEGAYVRQSPGVWG